MRIDTQVAERLQQRRHADLWRSRECLQRLAGNRVLLPDGCKLIDFASNDYLGLAADTDLRVAMQEAGESARAGSGSSALICGYTVEHRQLEEAFAGFVGRERSILFGSGFLANVGTIPALAGKATRVLMDRLAHASLIDGVRLSGARFRRFRHNDADHLDQLLAKEAQDPQLVITESVFSMDGDRAPLKRIADLCRDRATLLVDDAHAVGLFGPRGEGLLHAEGLTSEQVPVLVTPLGKALGGYGAMVSGSAQIIDAIEQFARSYIYSTAMPPLMAQANRLALDKLRDEEWRRKRLFERVRFANAEIERFGLDVVSRDETPIRAVLVGDNRTALAVRDRLRDAGFLVSAIRPPTVPNGTARIRLSINALHTENEIRQVLAGIADAIDDTRRTV